jgi:hypothetical protein
MFALIDGVLFPSVRYRDGGRAYAVGYRTTGKNTSSTLEERLDAIRRGLSSADMVVPYLRTYNEHPAREQH